MKMINVKSDQEIIEEQKERIKELEQRILETRKAYRTKGDIIDDICFLFGIKKDDNLAFSKLTFGELERLEEIVKAREEDE